MFKKWSLAWHQGCPIKKDFHKHIGHVDILMFVSRCNFCGSLHSMEHEVVFNLENSFMIGYCQSSTWGIDICISTSRERKYYSSWKDQEAIFNFYLFPAPIDMANVMIFIKTIQKYK